MRKLILFSALALVAMACAPLKVAIDRTDDEGVRTVVTSRQHLFKNYDFALGVRISPLDTIMGVIVEAETSKMGCVFNHDDHLYIELKDGSRMTLRNILDQDAVEIRKETNTDYSVVHPGWSYAYGPWGPGCWLHPYAATAYFEHSYETTVSDSYALYPITYDEIMGIITKGVSILRIEADDNTDEMPATSNLKEMFSDMFNCLVDGASHPGW